MSGNISIVINLERYGRYCGEEYLQEYSDGLIEIQ